MHPHLSVPFLLPCTTHVSKMSLQDLALSALASCFDPGHSSLSALDLFPFYSTFATFAQLALLTTGFHLIAFLLQRGILSPGYPSVRFTEPRSRYHLMVSNLGPVIQGQHRIYSSKSITYSCCKTESCLMTDCKIPV